jgi:predicted CXXCH cytochrome family protein
MKTGIALMLLLLATSIVFASDRITFGNGIVFDHQEHKSEVGMCSYCHDGTPGKIPGFGKEWAHKTCIGCHKDFREGPVTCAGCHKQTNKKTDSREN